MPPGFIGLVRKMMSRNPEQRFANAAEVEEKLRAWASEESVLPLDRQGDREYQEAVAALETEEAPPELIEEVIPVGIPVSDKRGRRRSQAIIDWCDESLRRLSHLQKNRKQKNRRKEKV